MFQMMTVAERNEMALRAQQVKASGATWERVTPLWEQFCQAWIDWEGNVARLGEIEQEIADLRGQMAQMQDTILSGEEVREQFEENVQAAKENFERPELVDVWTQASVNMSESLHAWKKEEMALRSRLNAAASDRAFHEAQRDRAVAEGEQLNRLLRETAPAWANGVFDNVGL